MIVYIMQKICSASGMFHTVILLTIEETTKIDFNSLPFLTITKTLTQLSPVHP